MPTSKLQLGALIALVLVFAFAPVADARSIKVQRVGGELAASDDTSEATGRFALKAITAGDNGNERLWVKARGLDADSDYEVFLGEDLESAVSFGEMKVRGKKGWGRLYFSSRRDDYPDGIDSLIEFSGQKMFVVTGEDTVLEGDIPTFAALDDEEVDEGAVAAGVGHEKLSASDEDSRAFGMVSAGVAIHSKGTYSWITVLAMRLDRDEDYDVVVVGEGDDDDVELGSLRFIGRRWGPGYLGLSSASEDGLPASVSDLGGLTLEVRDADGNVVLTGTFPTL